MHAAAVGLFSTSNTIDMTSQASSPMRYHASTGASANATSFSSSTMVASVAQLRQQPVILAPCRFHFHVQMQKHFSTQRLRQLQPCGSTDRLQAGPGLANHDRLLPGSLDENGRGNPGQASFFLKFIHLNGDGMGQLRLVASMIFSRMVSAARWRHD